MVSSRSLWRGLILLIPFLLVWGVIQHTDPATLVVDDDGTAPYASVQSAIDAAVPGQDDVFVLCGTYFENIDMRDGVSVSGERPGCTFLDPASDDQPVVSMTSLGSDTRLQGLTIRNRHSLNSGSLGVEISLGSPVITQNVIEGPGSPLRSGVGISVSGGTPVITYNIIRGNYDCCYGGGIVLDGSSAEVRSNLIVGNSAYYGAGIFVQYGDVKITNNTIVGNAAYLGGGMMNSGPAGVAANNVIAFNTAVIYGGGLTDWGLNLQLEANNVFGNQPDNYSSQDPTGANGNISMEPQFVDQNGTSFAGFQPRSSSPLIDAAASTWTSALDLRGIPRPVDGNVDSVARSDIGARENEGVTGLLHTGVSFVWDLGTHQPPDYNVYRGDLAFLKQTGIYTQDPVGVSGARHFCDVPNTVDDADAPVVGRAFFYLPAAYGVVEGTLGFDSDLVERPKDIFCLGP